MAAAFPVPAEGPDIDEDQEWLRTYRIEEKLGEGAYGQVYKAIHVNTGVAYALKKIKILYEEEGIPSTAIREVSLLKECNHPNVIRLHEVHSSFSELCMVFEFLDMDLRAYLKARGPLGEEPGSLGLRSATCQCLRGVDFCHGHRILHRDLKPQNVLVDVAGQKLKLADFGLARAFTVPLRPYTHEVVTLWYRAPEILLGQSKYVTPMDVWSIGCIVAEMATGQALFPGDSEIDTLFKIFRLLGTPNDEVWPGVSTLRDFSSKFPKWQDTELWEIRRASPIALGEDGQELLRGILRFNPVARPSARRALQHAFFDPSAVGRAQQATAALRAAQVRAQQAGVKPSRAVLNFVYRRLGQKAVESAIAAAASVAAARETRVAV